MIGIAGSEEKCSILTDQLGFDVAINYNKQNIKVADQIFAFILSQDNCHFTLTMKWQGHIICCFDKAQIHQKDSSKRYLIPVSSATSCSKRCTLLLWQCGRRYFSGAAKQRKNKIQDILLYLSNLLKEWLRHIIVDNQHVTAIMIFQAVLVNMAMYGRVAVCGAITGFHKCLQ